MVVCGSTSIKINVYQPVENDGIYEYENDTVNY